MSKLKTFTRRTFLIGSTAITGGVLFGYYQYQKPQKNPLIDKAKLGESVLTAYVKINQNGVTVITPRAEMGQGVHTTLAALVAEELDLPWESIKVEHGPASTTYHNAAVLIEGIPFAPNDKSFLASSVRKFTKIPAKFLGMQITGGSSSIVDAYDKMRIAGATARAVLIEAAAIALAVRKDTLFTYEGHVVCEDGRKLSYEALAPKAQNIAPPEEVKLKKQDDWKLLGQSLPRVDMVEKCTGTALFSIDIHSTDLLFATVKMNPNLGAKLVSYDTTKAEKMNGVSRIINLDNLGIAVIATNTWRAFKAADKIDVDWGKADYPDQSKDMFIEAANSFTHDRLDSTFKEEGDVQTVISSNRQHVISGEYKVPYLAHATMEPLNATVKIGRYQIEIWAGNQNPTQIVKEAEKLTGFDESNVIVHTTYMGGGFGRRAEMDFIKYAIQIAQYYVGKPVKTTWSREEDTTHDYYRPLALAKFEGVSSPSGISALDLQIACPSVLTSQMGRIGIPLAGPDISIVQAAWEQPYGIENYQVRGYRIPEMLPISSWRSVGASQNGFFHESVIDELAHNAGIDPVKCRLDLINHEPSKQVILKAAEMAKWTKKRANNIGLGIAFTLSFGVPVAEIIEVENTPNGIKILNVWAAVDVGIALDPRNIKAQVMSGINFGLAAAMMGEITVKDGMVEQTNFDQYDSIRMNQAPNIFVEILENGDEIRGIGEPGTPPAAPALGNAIFAVTGKRIRELPFNKSIKFV